MTEHIEETVALKYSRRALEPQRRNQVEEHLMECGKCRQTLRGLMHDVKMPAEWITDTEPVHPAYEQITAYVDGRLSEAQREAMEGHAIVCRNCREEMVALARLDAVLSGAKAKSTVASASQERVKVPLAERVREFFSPFRVRTLGFGLAMAIVGLTVVVYQNGSPTNKNSDSAITAQTKATGAGETSAQQAAGLGGLLLVLGGAGFVLYGVRGKRK